MHICTPFNEETGSRVNQEQLHLLADYIKPLSALCTSRVYLIQDNHYIAYTNTLSQSLILFIFHTK